jgi:hypothetical protein
MDDELRQAEKAFMDVSRELWGSGSYREDDALNISAFKLTTGEWKSQEEVEEIIGDPINPSDPEFYEKFCENFGLVVKAKDKLRLMGSLPYFHPKLLPLKEDHEDEPTFYDRFSRFVGRHKKGITLELLGIIAANIMLFFDSDKDGYSNLDEIRAGSNPLNRRRRFAR